MSDNEKNMGSREEFEGKEVRNTTPQIDEEAYDKINEKGRNLRSMDDNDYYGEDDEDAIPDEDNEIINSLLAFSKENNKTVVTEEEKKSKFSFGKTKKEEPQSEEKNTAKLSFGKKKTVEEAPQVNATEDISSDISSEDYGDEEETVSTPETKEKKSLFKKKTLFEGKKKPKKEANIEDIINEDIANDENVDDTYVNTIEDIERDIRKAKKHRPKGDKKLFIILGAALVVVIAIVGLLAVMGGDKNPPVENPVDTPVVEQPSTEDDFTSSEVNNTSYKQGEIKRILGNKVLITPDGETENTIYYVDNMGVIENFKAGNHVEYGYVIKNYLPYITEIIEIREGTIAYKGIMTINIMIDDTLVKFAYDNSLAGEIKEISTGDTIQYVYEDIEGTPTITNIVNIVKAKVEEENNTNTEYNPSDNPMTDDLYSGYIYDAKDFYEEHTIIDNRTEETREAVKSHIENNTLIFYNGITDPIWIRHAWRSTDLMDSVPSIDNVDIVLETPSGIQITNANIAEYGRMWLEGSIINYALKNPEIGEYKIIDNKPNGTFLGEAAIHLMGLSGFITIDKFGANLVDRDTLELIWNVTGVPDDGLEIEVYLTNDRFSTMVYSGSSKTEPLHIIDKRTVSISNLPKGKYNVVVTVRDIDMKTQADDPEIPENTIVIAAETISETKNVGILILQ